MLNGLRYGFFVSLIFAALSLPVAGAQPTTLPLPTKIQVADLGNQTKYDQNCGPIALCTICARLGKIPPSLDQAKQITAADPVRGTTMLGLKDGFTTLGLYSVGLELAKSDEILQQPCPMILPLKTDGGSLHYVVIAATDPQVKSLFVIDYPYMTEWWGLERLRNYWTGQALLVSTTPIGVKSVQSFRPWMIATCAVIVLIVILVVIMALQFMRNLGALQGRVARGGVAIVAMVVAGLHLPSARAEETPAISQIAPSAITVLPDSRTAIHPEVAIGSRVRDEFHIKNHSSTPITVEWVRKSCECIHHELSSEVIPPDGEVILTLQASTSIPGLKEGRILIKLSGIDQPLDFYQKAFFSYDPMAWPPAIRWEKVVGDEPSQQTINFLHQSDVPSGVPLFKEIVDYPTFLEMPTVVKDPTPIPETGDVPLLCLSAKPRRDLTSGSYAGVIRVKFTKMTGPIEFLYPVSVNVLPKYFVKPQAISFRGVPGVLDKKELTVRSRAPGDPMPSIRAVTTDSSLFDLSFTGSVVSVLLKSDRALVAEPLVSKISISIDGCADPLVVRAVLLPQPSSKKNATTLSTSPSSISP